MFGNELSLALVSYGLAFAGYLVLAGLLLTRYKGRLRNGLLAAAALTTSLWALFYAVSPYFGVVSASQLYFAEATHNAVWIVYVTALTAGAAGAGQYWLARYGGYVLVALIFAAGIAFEFASLFIPDAGGAGDLLIPMSVLSALFLLVAIEQIYRNARTSQRQALVYLCLGIGGIAAYNLFLYSNAIFFGELSSLFWDVRGAILTMFIPLLVIAVRRAPNWSVGIFLSRQIVFYSATLIGAGLYLTLAGFAAFYVSTVGGRWGPALQVLVFSAAIVSLFVFLFSDSFRGKIRVFLYKHFFRNKYDYREEWLRLVATLTETDSNLPLRKRAIKALAQILDAPAGQLWLANRDTEDFVCVSGWNTSVSTQTVRADSSLAEFFRNTFWVIDQAEYADDESRYAELDLADWPSEDDDGIVVPLFHEESLLGWISLESPTPRVPLNYEDRDLLKTSGWQIASYLAQEAATEQLAEGRQFEAFNRLTAYLMHDLKNVTAQQSLIVENAKVHKDNPEFIDDVISTVSGSVSRMKRVIDHLQQRPGGKALEKIEVGKVLMQVTSQCGDRKPTPRASISDEQVWIRGDRDRLQMALYNAIRNAQDASDEAGEVLVKLVLDDDNVSIVVSDKGEGMSAEFLSAQLFKPFESTKGTQGMGIGAHQMREAIRDIGGTVEVDSAPGAGTTVRFQIPLVS